MEHSLKGAACRIEDIRRTTVYVPLRAFAGVPGHRHWSAF